jgi:hypothetical protein
MRNPGYETLDHADALRETTGGGTWQRRSAPIGRTRMTAARENDSPAAATLAEQADYIRSLNQMFTDPGRRSVPKATCGDPAETRELELKLWQRRLQLLMLGG